MRVPACGLLLLGLWLGYSPPLAAQPALRPELERVERLPSSQNAARLQSLRAMQPQPGSAEALEQLYLLGVSEISLQRQDPLPKLQAAWTLWEQAAAASERPSAELARLLLRVRAFFADGRYREAREAWQAPAQLDKLPVLWRLRAAALWGNVLAESGELEDALVQHLEALTLAQASGSDWRRADALYDLAYTQSRLGQNERALESVDEMNRLLGADTPDADRSRALNLHAIVLQNAGREVESMQMLERALVHARRDGEQRNIGLMLANLSDGYLRRGEPQRALQLAEEALRIGERMKDGSTVSLALHNSGVAKILLGRIAEGKELVKRSITLELQAGGTTLAADGWRELGEYLEKAGDLAGAMQAFDAYRELADGLSRVDRRRSLGEAQARFDAAQRERNGKLLSEGNALREQQIRAQRLNFALGALALASAAALAALLWLLTKRLRQTNAQLALTNRELAAQSEIDPLTGLGNRRRLQQLVGNDAQTLEGTLVLIDIDHFKQLNDRYGHAGGDAVLVAVAGRLRNAVREPLGVMRWGGEEFLLYLRGADVALADALAQRLLAEVSGTPIALRDGRNVLVTASIGYAVFPVPGSAARFAVERAVDLVDALMYLAKSHGRQQAWGLVGARIDDAQDLRDALTRVGSDEAETQLDLRRWPPVPEVN